MSIMGFEGTDPVPCPDGCDLPVVRAITSVGIVTVHIGKWRTECIWFDEELQRVVLE